MTFSRLYKPLSQNEKKSPLNKIFKNPIVVNFNHNYLSIHGKAFESLYNDDTSKVNLFFKMGRTYVTSQPPALFVLTNGFVRIQRCSLF